MGSGDGRTGIEQKVQTLGLGDKVIFTGIRSDVPELMQAMDVFLFPSLYEGLPVTMVEAQAAGLPCVISTSIPDDCKLTDLVSTVSLDQPVSRWAQAIQAALTIPRRDTSEEIGAAGFDIRENARWLQNYYIQQWKAIE